jgi:hypothetical protein
MNKPSNVPLSPYERWLAAYAAEGLLALCAYLEVHAAFDRYCQEREHRRDQGAGASSA